jgi:hypothetical protein
MKRFQLWGALFLVPVLAFLITVGGCGGKKGDAKKSADAKKSDGDDKKSEGDKKSDDGDGGEEGAVVKGNGTATITGVAYFMGTPPTIGKVKPDKITPEDEKICNMGDMNEQFWKITKDGEKNLLANVVISLEAPKDGHFEVPQEQTWPKEVVVDQPNCAFIPHVSIAFPKKWDAAKGDMVPTGQKMIIKNSAPLKHNTRWGSGGLKNKGDNKSLEKGTQETLPIEPDKAPIGLNCDLHKWMSGYIWAFDHPFAAVTSEKKGAGFGTYEIKNAPAGVKVILKGWHEKASTEDSGEITAMVDGKRLDLKKGATITLTKGENKKIDIEVKK